jgi:hypothetical protein
MTNWNEKYSQMMLNIVSEWSKHASIGTIFVIYFGIGTIFVIYFGIGTIFFGWPALP